MLLNNKWLRQYREYLDTVQDTVDKFLFATLTVNDSEQHIKMANGTFRMKESRNKNVQCHNRDNHSNFLGLPI